MSADQFEAILNDSNEPVVICGEAFQAGTALRKLDPGMFNQKKKEADDATFN